MIVRDGIITGMNTKNATAQALLEDDPRSEANIARRRALGIAERDAQGRLLRGIER
jgi:hypothetical protein